MGTFAFMSPLILATIPSERIRISPCPASRVISPSPISVLTLVSLMRSASSDLPLPRLMFGRLKLRSALIERPSTSKRISEALISTKGLRPSRERLSPSNFTKIGLSRPGTVMISWIVLSELLTRTSIDPLRFSPAIPITRISPLAFTAYSGPFSASTFTKPIFAFSIRMPRADELISPPSRNGSPSPIKIVTPAPPAIETLPRLVKVKLP